MHLLEVVSKRVTKRESFHQISQNGRRGRLGEIFASRFTFNIQAPPGSNIKVHSLMTLKCIKCCSLGIDVRLDLLTQEEEAYNLILSSMGFIFFGESRINTVMDEINSSRTTKLPKSNGSMCVLLHFRAKRQ